MSTTGQPQRTDPDDARHVWLDVVAAVEYLARGPRWGLTLWDACEEAIRWWIGTHIDRVGPSPAATAACDDPDPFRTIVAMTIIELPSAGIDDGWLLADALQLALAQWSTSMAQLYNEGRHWPPPATPGQTMPAPPIDPDVIAAPDPLFEDT